MLTELANQHPGELKEAGLDPARVAAATTQWREATDVISRFARLATGRDSA
jgi:hypothetical protein